MRQSTSEHTRKTNLRLQERQDAPRRRRGAHRDRPLTQEELLAEAKITAEINIRSLGKNVLVKLLKCKVVTSSTYAEASLYTVMRNLNTPDSFLELDLLQLHTNITVQTN